MKVARWAGSVLVILALVLPVAASPPAPHVAVALRGVSVADAAALAAGEPVRVALRLDGWQRLAGVLTGTLRSTSPGAVVVGDATAAWPAANAADPDVAEFEVQLVPGIPCGTALGFEIALADAGVPAGAIPFEIVTGLSLDGPALRIGEALAQATPLRVVAGGPGFAVAFARPLAGESAVSLALLDGDGVPVEIVDIAPAPRGSARNVDVAWNGFEFGVAWEEDAEAGPRVLFARVAAAGDVPAAPVVVSEPGVPCRRPRLAWNGRDAEWAVTWEDGRGLDDDVRMARLDRAGASIGWDTTVAGGPGDQRAPAIAWDGQRYAVAWQDSVSGEWAVKLGWLSASGDSVGAPWSFGGGPDRASHPELLASTDGSAVLAFVDQLPGSDLPAIRVLRSDVAEAPVDRDAFGPAAAGLAPALAAAPDGPWLAWSGAPGLALRLGRAGGDPAGVPLREGLPGSAVGLGSAAGRLLAAWLLPSADGAELWVRAARPRSVCDAAAEEPVAAPPAPPAGPLLDCDPTLEICDGLDNDCDGSTDEETGTRYVAPTGVDADNACNVQGSPCATIGHAVLTACVDETISVAEGTYTEDVVLDKRVTVDASGLAINTQLHGTGTADIVSILAAGAVWDGIEVSGSAAHACLRIGDASHTGLRDVEIRNGAFYGCRNGIVFDSTGVPTGGGQWNRMLGVDLRDNVGDGSADGGVGLLLTGGNGKIEFKSSIVRNNAGTGLRVLAPPVGQANATIVIAGNNIFGNGSGANGDGVAGIEVRSASDVHIEGNDVHDHVGQAGDDGRGIVFDGVTGSHAFCTRIRNNETGFELRGGSSAISLLEDRFTGNTGRGLLVEAGAATQVSVNESIFTGNATGIVNQALETLDATHCWWGAASGPAPVGAGDAVSGPIDTSLFLARADAPVLVRRPADSGWDPSPDTCYQSFGAAAAAAAPGSLLLVGEGTYYEHSTITNSVNIEGVPGGSGCSPTIISGEQSGGTHLPALVLSGLSGIDVRNLTIRDTGLGNVCGQNTGLEIGLDLRNVSGSNFENLCLRQNGVTELRIYGNSDGNTFRNVSIDGAIRYGDGTDMCGHRSREGVLIDGGPACEGGAGAIAQGNVLLDADIAFVARGVSLQLADDTEIATSTINASPAAAWDGGTYSVSVLVGLADDTNIHDNEIGATGQSEGVRIAGRAASSCATEMTDSQRTLLRENLIRHTSGAGVRLYRGGGDPGGPAASDVSCNDIAQNGTGVLSDWVGAVGGAQNRLALNDVRLNTVGVRNFAAEDLPATPMWWNSPSGPGGAGPGTGDSVFGAVAFGPWLSTSARTDNDGDSYSECAGDCNDTQVSIFPGATEICNGVDDDCDGTIDDNAVPLTFYRDADGDGYGHTGDTAQGCTPPAGYVANSSDCNDADDSIHPGAAEACDAVDQDCDGSIDEGLPLDTFYRDADADGYGNAAQTTQACGATPPDGYAANSADCNDARADINPGRPEICADGLDNDCDGAPDGSDASCAGLAITGLRFQPGSASALEWNGAGGASSYGLYRGDIAAAGWGGYTHRCLASELPTPAAQDPASPTAGAAFYYLAGALVKDAQGEITGGPLGASSTGAWRPEPSGLACGPRVYVDPDAVGGGTGLSWADAFTTVSSALGYARSRPRALEVWVNGTVSNPAVELQGALRAGAVVLGGFAGSETSQWQRDPALNPTTWGGSGGIVVRATHVGLVLDGLALQNGTDGIVATLDGQKLELHNVELRGLSHRGVDVTADGPAGGSLVVDDSTFDGSAQESVRAVAARGTLGGRLRANSFAGGSAAAMRLEARPASGPAEMAVEVLGNTVSGGAAGAVLGAYGDDAGHAATLSSLFASNLVRTTSAEALRVEASASYATFAGASAVRAIPAVVGNTLSGGGAGLRCLATRSDTTANPALHEVRATPQVWDNLLTFAVDAAIEESADSVATNLVADPVVVGNDFFGSAVLYRDEGTTPLGSIASVNALAGARDNYDQDPLYVNRPAGDYHLQPGSPCLDRGHNDAPARAALDIDGQPRVRGVAPDTGADER
ncbi:MAG: right-handed parallel beta-helix repeat-containing protein [Acidobacteria bacterium]|nr:right-handed parallel beta-helix repeat-containing protein [Acidobacteriota bacterium]